MAFVPYFCRKDLVSALGAQTVSSVYDDDSSGQADLPAIDACIEYGTSECESFLRANHGPESLPATAAAVPLALKFAALDFGIAYTMRRRPDIVRALNEESWTKFLKFAIEKMRRYGETLQRLPLPAEPTNIGVSVVENDVSKLNEPSQRTWDDMGLF